MTIASINNYVKQVKIEIKMAFLNDWYWFLLAYIAVNSFMSKITYKSHLYLEP